MTVQWETPFLPLSLAGYVMCSLGRGEAKGKFLDPLQNSLCIGMEVSPRNRGFSHLLNTTRPQ